MSEAWIISVAQVVQSTGVRDRELAWAQRDTPLVGVGLREFAEYQGRVWYDDTDQSGRCEITLRLAAPCGTEWLIDMTLEPEIAVRITRTGVVRLAVDL